MREHKKFPKILRSNGDLECYVTEKLDGTNAQIYISDTGEILAGSRNRWVTPEDDNYGFARWVHDNRGELLARLSPGRHYGEWWGQGIQRTYGLKEKRFSPFNPYVYEMLKGMKAVFPIPWLYKGNFSQFLIAEQMEWLAHTGSLAVPGWTKPEGIVVYIPDLNAYIKQTFDGPKWKSVLANYNEGA